jgi:glycosyltransferase involved in cell wall biosynthesis
MVLLVAPKGNDIISGGYRYNELVSSRLPEHRFASRGIADPRELPEIPETAELSKNDAVLVDSLFFHYPEAVEELRSRHRGALWMLLHYFPSLDPTLAAGEAERLRGFEERCLRVCDGTAAAGVVTVRELERRREAPGRLVYAPPGIEPEFFAAANGRGGRADTKMITVANWTPLKNHAFLLPILEELKDRRWTWRIVGDCRPAPEVCGRFRLEADQRGFNGRVRVHGAERPEEVAKLLGRSDVYLSPSLLESYGMSTAEAMAAGCAVVASRSGGSAELITDEVDGLLCDPQEPEQWRKAVDRLLRSSAERRRLGAAARRTAEGFPGWDETARKLLRGIEATLEKAESAGIAENCESTAGAAGDSRGSGGGAENNSRGSGGGAENNSRGSGYSSGAENGDITGRSDGSSGAENGRSVTDCGGDGGGRGRGRGGRRENGGGGR